MACGGWLVCVCVPPGVDNRRTTPITRCVLWQIMPIPLHSVADAIAKALIFMQVYGAYEVKERGQKHDCARPEKQTTASMIKALSQPVNMNEHRQTDSADCVATHRNICSRLKICTYIWRWRCNQIMALFFGQREKQQRNKQQTKMFSMQRRVCLAKLYWNESYFLRCCSACLHWRMPCNI